jgi:hypothetical protein
MPYSVSLVQYCGLYVHSIPSYVQPLLKPSGFLGKIQNISGQTAIYGKPTTLWDYCGYGSKLGTPRNEC